MSEIDRRNESTREQSKMAKAIVPLVLYVLFTRRIGEGLIIALFRIIITWMHMLLAFLFGSTKIFLVFLFFIAALSSFKEMQRDLSSII